MSKKILIELTEDEAETLADSIEDHVSEMYDFYGYALDEYQCMAGDKKILDTISNIKIRILTALERSEDDQIDYIRLTEGQLKLLIAAGCDITKEKLNNLIECAKSLSWLGDSPDADYSEDIEKYLGEQK